MSYGAILIICAVWPYGSNTVTLSADQMTRGSACQTSSLGSMRLLLMATLTLFVCWLNTVEHRLVTVGV